MVHLTMQKWKSHREVWFCILFLSDYTNLDFYASVLHQYLLAPQGTLWTISSDGWNFIAGWRNRSAASKPFQEMVKSIQK